ncbi:MAG TPA: adenosylcobinamide-GDP ribazoletransferase [Puia sp.]|jgi:adenosylcobinamide-GDP ribazoletransferase
MKTEWKIFLTAVQFMTRLRVPVTIVHEPVYLQQAPRYFPVIGWIVGALSALAFLVFSRYVSTDAGILASMITGLLVTGAFHEDGFADVCDGMGGGWTREKILQIMKDSRIGAFGAIGLIAILASKFVLLKELSPFTPSLLHPVSSPFYNYRYFILATLTAHSVSRLMPVLVMQVADYASDPDQSKSKDITSRRLSAGGLTVTILLALAPYAFLPWPFWLTILPALYATYELNRYFRRWIGGYTGDCLGAIQQVTELVIYLGFVIVWRYF